MKYLQNNKKIESFLNRISSIDQYEKLLDEKSNRNQLILDNLNNKHYLISREVLRLLERGLKQRVQFVCPINQKRLTVNISSTELNHIESVLV